MTGAPRVQSDFVRFVDEPAGAGDMRMRFRGLSIVRESFVPVASVHDGPSDPRSAAGFGRRYRFVEVWRAGRTGGINDVTRAEMVAVVSASPVDRGVGVEPSGGLLAAGLLLDSYAHGASRPDEAADFVLAIAAARPVRDSFVDRNRLLRVRGERTTHTSAVAAAARAILAIAGESFRLPPVFSEGADRGGEDEGGAASCS